MISLSNEKRPVLEPATIPHFSARLMKTILQLLMIPGLLAPSLYWQPALAASSQRLPFLDGTVVTRQHPEIAAIVYGAALLMRHEKTLTYPVLFTAEARKTLQSDAFHYRGFGRPSYKVLYYLKDKNRKNRFSLGVIMQFMDGAARSTSVFCSFAFFPVADHITITNVRLRRIVAQVPRTMISVVPAEEVPDNLFVTMDNHLALMRWLVRHALKEEDLPKRPTRKKYVIFATTLDRVTPGAQLLIRVSNTQQGKKGESGYQAHYDCQGWVVTAIRGSFAFQNKKKFFIKILYAPGSKTRKRKTATTEPILVGIYSSDLTLLPAGNHPKKP